MALVCNVAWADITQQWTTAPSPWGTTDLTASQYPEGVGTVLASTGGKVRLAETRVTAATDGNVTVKFVFSGGSHKLNVLGVDLVDANGTVVVSDYHHGTMGGSHNNNTYTLSNVAAGDYTLRYFVCNAGNEGDQVTNTNGNITVTGLVEWVEKKFYTITIQDALTTIKIGDKTYSNGQTCQVAGTVKKSDITVVAPDGKFAAVSIDDVAGAINVYFATLPTQAASATYTNAVLYPAQQTEVGEAQSSVSNNVYTLSNNVLAASFAKMGGALYFAGSKAMDLVAGTEPFTVAFGAGDNVPASAMTLVDVKLEDLAAKANAVGGAEHYKGKAIVANYTYTYEESTINIVWRAVLRDGSHYLRTEMELTGEDDVDMFNIIPMIYNVDTKAAGSTPEVIGNTRGAVLMSNKIFAGLETPTAYNTVGDATGEEDNWNLTATIDPVTIESNAWVQMTEKEADQVKRVEEATGASHPYLHAFKKEGVELTEGQKVEVTLTYKQGAHKLYIGGIDLLAPNGDIAAMDYHAGYTGSAHDKNTYTFVAPNTGTYTIRAIVHNKSESIDAKSELTAKIYTPKEGVVINTDIVGIQGRWSRNTTLAAGETWKVAAVVGLIAQDGTQANADIHTTQKRRSFLAYSERERAVPWRAMSMYLAWYELQINRNNADPGREHLDNTKAEDVLDVLAHWKSDLYDRYGIAPEVFIIDDGWDKYGEWTFHDAFPNEMRDISVKAKEMGAGIGAWLGPVGGYGASGNHRRAYWNGKGGMQLSNPDYYAAFKKAAHNLVKNQGDNYIFFKFDGISGQFSSVGPDAGDTGNENAEGIIRLEQYVREELREDIFFNTSVGTWASPFWYQITDATWRQENDHDRAGNNSTNRENWITYRDRLVYQNYVKNSPICPINTLMTHGFILTKFGPPASDERDYLTVRNELRAAFLCGSGMVEVYNDYDLMNSINGGALWADLAECIAWQKRNADVLPDAHWVGGNPWTGTKAEVYGWAAWNGTKSSLALRNGANEAQTFTFTLRSALNIPKHVTGSIILRSAFGDQATLEGLTEGKAYGIDESITVTLPGSSVYGFEGISSTATIKPVSSLTISTENDATEITAGQSLLVKAAINSDATFPALAWTSSNPEIATVENGLIIPKKDGEVTITVATKDGSNKTQSVKVKITPAPIFLNAGMPENGKQYYIYADTYSGGAFVNRLLYNNNGTLSMTTTLEEGNNNFLWTCHIDANNKYTFQNVGDNTKWLGYKELTGSAYNFTLGKTAASHEGTTLFADGGDRYLVVKNDGSGFNQSSTTYNQTSGDWCTDFVFANFFQPEGNSISISTNYAGGGNVLVNGEAVSLPYTKWENMIEKFPITLTATTANSLFNFVGFFKDGVNVGKEVTVESLAEAVEYEARYEFTLIASDINNAVPVRIYSNNNNSYAIKMNAANDYTGKAVNSGTGTYEANEVWYLVGDASSFKMYSKVAGNTLALKLAGTGQGSAATLAAEGTELTLVAQADGSYNICPKSNTGQSFNMFGGVGYDIKLYASSDGGSKWRFQAIDLSKALTLNYNTQLEGGYAGNYKIGELSINIAGVTSKSMLDKTNIPASRTCYLPEGAEFGISTGLMCHGWTITFNGSESIDTQALPEGGLTVNVNIAVDEDNKYQYLYYSPGPGGHPYRIPAIATTANGYVFAINDYRPCGNDIGYGEVDLVMRHSTAAGSDWDGHSWTESVTIADGMGDNYAANDTSLIWKVGFGDPAIVADRESNQVLVLSVCGNQTCWDGTFGEENPNPNRMARLYITYNETTGEWEVGEPEEVTYDVYRLFENKDGEAYAASMFIGAGRIAQSSKVKVGTHYRIYCAVWTVTKTQRQHHNYALYSDDFGKTWHVLGELGYDNCPSKWGNEPKCEELPDGSVLLSSRKGYGRYFNVFRYTDVATGEGAWMGEVSTDQVGDLKWGANSTNGEPLRIGNVLFQSAPTGEGRSDVSVFYKVLSNDPADYTPTKLSNGWTEIEVSHVGSAYSSMTILPDGNIGLFYEEEPGGYSMVYVPLILKDILPADVYAALSALPPTYASEQTPVWHSIKFNESGNVLYDQGAGNNAATSADTEADAAMWNVVGTQEQFYLVSKLGNYLAYNKDANRYTTTNNKKERVALTLKENVKGSWEIMRKGATKSLCEVAVRRSITNEVSEDATGGEANQVLFDDQTPEIYDPNIFSTEKEPVYYQVIFKNGGWALADKGNGENALTATKDAAASNQYWQFIGTPESFYMKSKEGNWLGFANDFYNSTTAENKVELRVFTTANGSYAGAYEIQRTAVDINGNCMNMYQGAGDNKQLSEWGKGDGGNPVTFMAEPAEIVPLPYFSTEETPEYWWIQFCTGGATLADQGADTNAQTATKAYNDAQLWQLVGNEGSFYMKNKAGRYLSWSGSRFQTTANAESKATLILHESSNAHIEEAGCYEIQLKGNSYMNQNGGTGAGKELGTWNAGDNNNHLVFVSANPTYPDFNNEEAWYYIQFGNGKCVIEDKGADNKVQTASLNDYTSQRWRVTGTKDNCQIISEDGRYLVYKNDRIYTSTTADAKGFKLVVTGNSNYPLYLEIQHNSTADKAFNMHGGAGNGKEIGLWDSNDPNNPLLFVDAKSVTYPEYAIAASDAAAPAEKLTLWYTQSAPATGVANTWMEYSLPLGNGQFGASLFGGVAKDEILFNDKTLWSGGPGEYGYYLPFGSVYIEDLSGDFTYNPTKPVQNYYRDLNLKTATGTVSYENAEGVKITRQYIASNPDKAIVTKITASEAGKLSFRITMESGKPTVKAETTYKNGYAQFSGKLQTVSYNATLKVVAENGYVSTGAEGITVEEADEVLIVLMGSTDFVGNDASHHNGRAAYLADDNKAIVDAVAKKGWDAVYADHVADHQSYFNRVDFQLAGIENTVPTNQLITDYNAATGARNHMLELLYYQYGRYLSIASSRGADSPANLQGIWNNTCTPPWHSDIHANINVQMNYWPVEAGNLSEMHEPFVNYIINEAAQPEWRTIASNKGGKREDGWTLLTENNIFGGVSGFAPDALINNAWYVTHMWQHYRYTLDTDYLRRAFAAMKGASLFWVDRLVLAADGTYECPNEYSPEHGPGQENATAHAQQIVRECLSNTIQAAEVLNAVAGGLISEEDYDLLVDRHTKMDKGLAIEQYEEHSETGWPAERNGIKVGDNILREWKYSRFYVSNDHGHRHMSHLMALFPFGQLTEADTELFPAAINSMLLRGDESTGWSMGWKINLWARARRADRSHAVLRKALKHSTSYGTNQGAGGIYYNLFDSHAPFQIDGNFGAASGVQEMLMQSHTEVIDILPALPEEWSKGSIKGLKAVGNFTVDIAWEDNQARTVVITNHKGQPCYVKCENLAAATVTVNGEAYTLGEATEHSGLPCYEIASNAGDEIVIDLTSAIVKTDKSELEALIAATEELKSEAYDYYTQKAKLTDDQNAEGYYVWSNALQNGSSVGNLFDDDPESIFHSNWQSTTAPEDGLDHHLTIELGEDAVSLFKFSYQARSGSNLGDFPTIIKVQGSTDGTNYDDIATIEPKDASGNPVNYGKIWTSDILGNGNAYNYLRFMVTNTTTNKEKDGHIFWHMAEFDLMPYSAENPVKKYPNSVFIPTAVAKANTELETANANVANDALSVYDYETSLANLQAAYDELATAIASGNLPVLVSLDTDNPIVYKIGIARGANKVLEYDLGTTDMVAVADYAEGNVLQGWYFTKGSNDAQAFIHPYVGGGDVLAAKSTGNAPAAVWATPKGTMTHQEWTIPVVSSENGTYNIKAADGTNYFSNNGGTGNKMGFWGSDNTTDTGSLFTFERISIDGGIWNHTLTEFVNRVCTEANVPATPQLGYITRNEAYDEAYDTAAAIAAGEATESEKQAAYIALRSAYEGLEICKPEAGKFYTIANNGNYITGSTTNDGKIALSTTNDANVIYYFDGSHLLSYSTGLYIGLNSSDWAFEAVGTATNDISTVEFSESTVTAGEFSINCGGRWLHNTDNAYVNRCQNNTCGAAHSWKVVEVTSLPVTISSVGFATLYAPVALSIPEGVDAFVGTLNDAKDELTLSDVTEQVAGIPAETGVVLRGNEGTYNFDIVDELKEVESDFVGNKETVAKTEGTAPYTLQKHDFDGDGEKEGVAFKLYTGTNITGFKAYLDLTEQSQAPAVRIRFGKAEGTTDIADAELTIDKSQLIIYDMQGRRVENPTKGMYIVNGKKVVVK